MAWDDTFVFKATKITSTQLNALITHIKTLITGTAGTTTNAIVRANGSTGLMIQGSAATIDDNGTITIPAGQAYNIGSEAITLNDLSDVTMTSPVKGDLIKHDGTDFKKFEKGTAGHYLKVNSLGTDLEYAAGTAGSGDVAHDTIWTTKGDLAVATTTNAASVLPVGTSIDQVLTPNPDEATGLKWVSVRPPLGKDAEGLTISQDNGGVERYFFKDDFSNDTSANYTLSGTSPTISGGHLIIPATGQAYHTITAGTTGRWEGVVQFTEAGAGTAKLLLGDAGTSYVAVTRIVTTDRIWLQLYIGGVSKIANTDTTVTLAEDVSANVSAVYDGTSWQMYWAGVAVGANTAAITVTTPIIGAAAATIANAWSELTFSPSAAFTETFALDSETRYMQLSSTDLSTWAASAAGDVVVTTGQITLSSADDKGVAAILRSYNFASGSIDCSFNDAGDGGGGDGSCNLVFGYQDSNNYYRLALEDNAAGAENLKLWKVVAGVKTQLGTTKDVSATYTRGHVTWLRVDWDAQRGQIWAYLRDTSGNYPTTPDIADAFSAQFTYGKAGFMATTTTAGAGNLSAGFGSFTCRSNLLIGETNIPATESGFYFRDEFSVNDSGRWAGDTTQYTWTGTTLTSQSINNYIINLPPKLSDIDISLTVTFPNYSGANKQRMNIWLVDRSTTSGVTVNGYRFQIWRSTTGEASECYLSRFDAGTPATLGSATSLTFADATPYIMRLTRTGGAWVCYIDGVSKITATDSTYTGLYPGVGVYNNAAETTTIDNLTISGTRYYMKPMLRGSQLGEYYNGAATVQATRFTSDSGWNQIAEFTTGGSASAYDTTNGWLTLADATAIYPTGINMSTGHYAFQLKRSTGATDVFNCNIAGNAITITGAGVTTIGGTAYTGTALTSPVWLEFVATGTQIAVYSNGVLIGTKTGLTLTPGTIQLSRTTQNIYVLAMNFNALDTTSPSGISASLGGVPHGARYDVQEEVYTTITNAAKSAEKVLVTCAMTPDNTGENVELYLKNTTDGTDVSVSSVVDLALTTANWTDQHVDMSLNYQDRDDTIKVSARRKTYAVADDADPAVFVQYLYVAPVWEV